MPFRATELSIKHEAEIELTVRRSLAQWLKGAEQQEPRVVVSALERVLVFLRQNGSPTQQSQHVTALALSFGAQVVRAAEWKWMNVSEDDGLNPGIVHPQGTHACLPVDAVTRLLLRDRVPSLPSLFKVLAHGPLPTPVAQALVVLP